MKRYLLAVVASGFLFACGQQQGLPPDLVAQVEDSYLRKEVLNYSVPSGLAEKEQLSMKKSFIRRWVQDEILYHAAKSEGIELDEKEKHQLREFEKALLVEAFLERKLNRKYTVSQKEIEDYYEENNKEFVRGQDELHLIHLLVEERDLAIFREIDEAKDLNSIIEKYYFESQSTYERPNGDLGYISRNSLPEEILKVERRMKTGAISRPIKTDHGYHFIQVLDRRDAGTIRELELVEDEIVRRLKWQKRNEEFERLIADLRENYQIQTYLSKVQ